MRLQFGFEQAAELIGDDSGEAALEWRKTVNVGEPMLLQQASDIRKRVGSWRCNRQNGIAADIGITAVAFVAQAAVEKCEVRPIAETASQSDRVRIGDFPPQRLA